LNQILRQLARDVSWRNNAGVNASIM